MGRYIKLKQILFNLFLDDQYLSPEMCGYDRPSNKFLNFLKKHYGLKDYIPQNNNFVIFDDYFINTKYAKKKQTYIPLSEKKSTTVKKYNDYKKSSFDMNENKNTDNKINIYNSASKNKNKDTPWATTGTQNNFVPSSSAYGSYYFNYKNI